MMDSPFFFVQISDPQFGMFGVDKGAFRETRMLEKAVSHVNRLAPAFVLNTGDLINDPGDEKQLAEVLRITRQIDGSIRLYTIPGNHDISDNPTEQNLDWYRKRIGKDWYSFDYNQWHFVGLNSCIIARAECAPQDAENQWNWLNHDLGQAASTCNPHIIIFMHHPLFLDTPDEADDYFNIPRQIRQVYLDLFAKYGVKTVLAGHLHRSNIASDSSLEVVVTGPVGMPLGDGRSGFRIVKVYDDHIAHKYFGLDDVIDPDF